MLHAAEAKDIDRLISLNLKFSPEYSRLLKGPYEKVSLPDLYDTARNKLLNAINDVIFLPEERVEELAEARRIISRIPKP